jgi:hypothetical protein
MPIFVLAFDLLTFGDVLSCFPELGSEDSLNWGNRTARLSL